MFSRLGWAAPPGPSLDLTIEKERWLLRSRAPHSPATALFQKAFLIRGQFF
jgi:hypothetical protein